MIATNSGICFDGVADFKAVSRIQTWSLKMATHVGEECGKFLSDCEKWEIYPL